MDHTTNGLASQARPDRTTRDDLTTFAAPGPRRPAGEPIPPHRMVQLVDTDGTPLRDCDRATEVCPPDPTDPADWPGWVDSWRWVPTDPDDLEDLDVDDLAEEEALELEPFEPTAEDLADQARWSADLEARRDQEDHYRRNPLSAFNADRAD